VTPDRGPFFPKFLTPGPDPGPKEKRRIQPESTQVSSEISDFIPCMHAQSNTMYACTKCLLQLFPCYSLLWVPDIYPKCFNLHITHQKSNFQTLFLYFEKQNNWKTLTGQKFRLTLLPDPVPPLECSGFCKKKSVAALVIVWLASWRWTDYNAVICDIWRPMQ